MGALSPAAAGNGTCLGIDGGGSKTRFLLVDEHDRAIARAETGPSNWLSVGQDAARAALGAGIASLPALPDIACGGFAGAGQPESARFFLETLQALLPGAQVLVETDAFIAYVGAIGLRPGVLLIAGTGSIAIGRRRDGRMIRAGGWGPMFGDEGGGFWIGREALRIALRAADRHEFPEFIDTVRQGLGVATLASAVSLWATGRLGVPAVAALAPAVLRLYPDEPARRIVEQAGAHLRDLAETAEQQLAVPDSPRSIAGSIGSDPLMQQVIGLALTPPLHPPERGAILWSRAAAVH